MSLASPGSVRDWFRMSLDSSHLNPYEPGAMDSAKTEDTRVFRLRLNYRSSAKTHDTVPVSRICHAEAHKAQNSSSSLTREISFEGLTLALQ